ncbi:MAG: ATP:cob(I)alamin adenosyltransferase [Lachnospiraceae bacterium]|nr:ATP:cob(I)alamin adenosyltransferase [Lachnospiraceae bacterium]
MEMFTGSGDRGMTSLKRDRNVSKADDRIQAIGEIEDLITHIGMIKLHADNVSLKADLEKIQRNLLICIEGINDPYHKDYKISEEEVKILAEKTAVLKESYPMTAYEPLPGGCEASLRIDMARSVARRAERWLTSSDKKYGGQPARKQYMNLLGDYLYALARYTDYVDAKKPAVYAETVQSVVPVKPVNEKVPVMELTKEIVVQEVLKRIQTMDRVTLEIAKKLIEKIEGYATSVGKKAVIAVCGPDGNPIAVHVMDGAFLVSFDVAVKKAYTAVSVKMSTMELGKLVQPGQTFAGLEQIEKDKLVFFGGGVPLFAGENLVGGLGISGGTGEEDDDIAQYALSVFEECCK